MHTENVAVTGLYFLFFRKKKRFGLWVFAYCRFANHFPFNKILLNRNQFNFSDSELNSLTSFSYHQFVENHLTFSNTRYLYWVLAMSLHRDHGIKNTIVQTYCPMYMQITQEDYKNKQKIITLKDYNTIVYIYRTMVICECRYTHVLNIDAYIHKMWTFVYIYI